MRKIVVFPGRFQPMGKHHLQVYSDLVNKFGDVNVFVATSNSTNATKNPLTYDQKRSIALKMGIPSERIFRNDTPYKVENTLLDLRNQLGIELDPSRDMLIFAYGEKDLGRFPMFDRDGASSYFKAYTDEEYAPIQDRAYLYAAPMVTIKFKNDLLSGTALRNYLSKATEQDFKDTMGFYDRGVHQSLAPALIKDEEEIYDDSKVLYYEQYLRNILPSNFHVLTDGKSLTVQIPSELLQEKIVKRSGKYYVYSADGSKKLGEHDSKEEAVKQLKAIHLSQKLKHN